MHATADISNVLARVNTFVAGLDLPGAPELVYSGQPFEPSGGAFVRATVATLPGSYRGHTDTGTKAFEVEALVTLDVFWPDGSKAAASDVYAADRVASALADAFRLRTLPFLDYRAAPAAPTSVEGSPIRFEVDTTPRRLPPVDGYTRRQVTATGRWLLRHSA